MYNSVFKEANMAIDFMVKDIMHKVLVKFVHAFLPDAKKPYNLRAVFQPELGIHEIASKADVYNIETDPKVIEEGFTAACELIYYLTADGYKLKTPLFNLRMRLPGEYIGSETALPEGVYPEVRMRTALAFRQYIRDRVKVQFDGIDEAEGLIAEVRDELSGQVDERITIGNLITILGYGLKIEAEDKYKDQAGIWFEGGTKPPVKAAIVAVNEPRMLKVIVPATLPVETYTLKIVTQCSVKGGGTLLKNLREVKADFVVIAWPA
jgi:hypothetical protein